MCFYNVLISDVKHTNNLTVQADYYVCPFFLAMPEKYFTMLKTNKVDPKLWIDELFRNHDFISDIQRKLTEAANPATENLTENPMVAILQVSWFTNKFVRLISYTRVETS